MARDINIKIGATDTASTVFAKVSKNVTKLNASLNKVGTSLQNAGAFSSGAGRRLAAAGGAITGAFAIATKTFAGFDDSMAAVSAKSGATGESLMGLRDLAKELGSTTKFSASEAASGMEFLAQAGFKTEQIMAAIGPALSLAAAGGVELNEAADIASNVAAGFGLSADEFGRVADVMARAATSANTDILMMGETFTQSASIAKTAGQSIEETAAALGLLANSGIQASSAGTDIKNVLSRLAIGEVQKKIEKLGVTVKDSSGEFRPMLDIMRDFGQATADMKGPDKLALSMELFGKISGKSALILSDAGDEVDSMRLKMVDASVTAETMAATMQTGLGGLGTTIMSSLEGVQIAIGEAFKGPLTAAGESITGILRGITAWVNQNQSLVIAIGAASIAVTGLGVSLLGLGVVLATVGAAISGISVTLGVLGSTAAVVFTPVGAVVAGLAVSVAYLGSMFLQASKETGVFAGVMAYTEQILRQVLVVAKATVGGIADALKSGDWALAARIGWAGVEAATWGGLIEVAGAFNAMLPKIWETIVLFFKRYVKLAGESAKIAAEAIANPANGMAKAAAFLSRGFDLEPNGDGLTNWARRQRIDSLKELIALRNQAKAQTEAIGKDAPSADLAATKTGISQVVDDAASAAAKFMEGINGKIESSVSNGIKSSEIKIPKIEFLPPRFPKSIPLTAPEGRIEKKQIEIQATQSRLLTRGPANNESERREQADKERKQQLSRIDEGIRGTQELLKQGLGKSPFEIKVIA